MKQGFKSAVLISTFCVGMTTFNGKVNADAVDDAFRLCSALEETGLTTECEVKGWGSTVDVRIDTTSSEERKMCAGVVDMMAQQTRSFGSKWEFRIFSPYSGDHPIAKCTLL